MTLYRTARKCTSQQKNTFPIPVPYHGSSAQLLEFHLETW